MAQKTLLPTFPGLTRQQSRWVELVAQGESDLAAYRRCYNCKTEGAAQSNAYKLRKNPKVLEALIKVQAAVERLYLSALAPATKKGRLARVMMEGSDADAIRAIKELNHMEERERAMGGGEGTQFDELVMLVARKRRVLPFQDKDDLEVIDLEPSLPR